MILKGQFNEAKVFVDSLDINAQEQILTFLNHEISANTKIRIMPDVHLGKGSVIGMTLKIKDSVIPNMVGVDIGCGLIVLKLKDRIIDYRKLDDVIRRHIPSGFNIRKTPHKNAESIKLESLRCKKEVDLKRGYLSIGTLGGGNHFIEINEDEDFNKYLVIHSGSRHLGLQTANTYQRQAQDYVLSQKIDIPRDLAYLKGKSMKDYLHDMEIIQKYAALNRETMAQIIVEEMGFEVLDRFQTIHNYIDLKHMILRKGAVSAQEGERFIIPFNMRDGSVIMEGKGNEDWNYSAPHGAGRVMSRKQARRSLKLSDYRESLSSVFTTSISLHTIDEAPMVYKKPKDILYQVKETATHLHTLKSLYNFKSK